MRVDSNHIFSASSSRGSGSVTSIGQRGLPSVEELQKLNTKVFGVSTQSREYQKEVIERLHLLYKVGKFKKRA